MTRSTTNGMHAVRCDWKPTTPDYVGSGFCREIFRSNSMLSVLAKQLEVAGWFVQVGTRTRPAIHLCPEHKPRNPWEGQIGKPRTDSG